MIMGAFLRILAGAVVWFLLVTVSVGLLLALMFGMGIIGFGQGDFIILNAMLIGAIYGGFRGYRTPF